MRKNRKMVEKGKTKYAVVADGECEFWYIQMLKRNERVININLKPELRQKKKLSDQYKQVKELSTVYDKVFWLIDFDVINKESREAKKGTITALQEFKGYYEHIKKCCKNIIVIIVNNPCFEYWFLLHFEVTSKYYNSYDDVITQLKKHLPDYEKTQKFYTKQGNDIYLRLKPYLSDAIFNAKKLDEFDFANPQSGLSQMQFFFEDEEIRKIRKRS